MNALLNRSSTNNKVTGKAAGRLTRSFYLIAICFPDLEGKPRSDFSGYFAVSILWLTAAVAWNNLWTRHSEIFLLSTNVWNKREAVQGK